MYPAAFEYLAPKGIGEAIEFLSLYGDDAKLLAGGQSLVPMMKLRVARPKYLIDIHRLADGRMAEHWHVVDQLSQLQQLGALPSPAPAS